MSDLRIAQTNHSDEAKLSVVTADTVAVTKMDKMIEEIASISIDNLGALFRIAAQNANELRGLFGLLAENHRKMFLEKAKDIKAIQGGWGSTASHLANVGGSVVSGYAGKEKLIQKAIGGGLSASGSVISSRQQADSTYEGAMKDAVNQSMQNAYGDMSRNQQQVDECMRTLDAVKSAMQGAKAAMLR